MTDKTLIFASSDTALNLIPEALVGAKAMQLGGHPAQAMIQIPGVTANGNEHDGATYELDKVPSTAVIGGRADIYGATALTVDLKAGEAITVRGMLDTGLKAYGVTLPPATPAAGMKR